MRHAALLSSLLVVLLTLTGSGASAQQATPSIRASDAACGYDACALTIAPRWDGLAVVAGRSGRQVANLHFFWPRDVTSALEGPDGRVAGADSAARYSRRAVHLRRIGASLTDAGLLLAVAGALRFASNGEIRGADRGLFAAGGAALLISVPFQFAADGALSRAVWWHNARYSR